MSELVVSDKGTFIVYTREECEKMGIDVSKMKSFNMLRDAGIDLDNVVRLDIDGQVLGPELGCATRNKFSS